jgi:hypothetical protein
MLVTRPLWTDADRILGDDAIPRIGLSCFMPRLMRWVSLLNLDDLHLDGLADRQGFRRMVDAAPGDVGDVQQAVDAAQIHERAVFGDVLDHAVDDLAFGQVADDFGALFGAGLFQDGAARDDDVAAARSILRIWNGCFMPISGPTSRTGRTSTWLPGRKATAPPRSTVKPPLTRPKIAPTKM